MGDDRAAFEATKRDSARRMADDADLMQRARQVSVDADRHQWSYQWSFLGLPIIQMPTDVLATQEIIWAARPEVIVETGVARGGSVILSSALLQLIGSGRVIGVDVEIRPHNRAAIEGHPLGARVTLVEGSSTDAAVVARVQDLVGDASRVMVVLDSNHTHAHVLAELEAYAPMVTAGQYLIVADTAIEAIPVQDHRPRDWGPGDNPMTALREYLRDHPEFEPDEHVNAKLLLTASPGGYLRRLPA